MGNGKKTKEMDMLHGGSTALYPDLFYQHSVYADL